MRHGTQAGFTLIEALIAIVVLVFGLIAVANLFVVATSSNVMGNITTATTTAATETMEALKALPFDDAALAPGGDDCVTDSSAACPTTCSGKCRSDNIAGVGTIVTRWRIEQVPGDKQSLYIKVRSEGTRRLGGMVTRAEFTTFRTCTATGFGCPARS